MKRTRKIIIAFAVILIGFVVWQLNSNRRLRIEPPGTANSDSEAVSERYNDNARVITNSSEEPVSASNSIAGKEKMQKLREQAIESANDEWRAPIDFFGKVVDEHGAPVGGAKVALGLNNLDGHTLIETTTDDAGLFELRGKQGKHLSVRVSREGYYSSNQDPTGFFYAGQNENFVSDQANPVIFHLRKKGKSEMLVTSTGRVKVPLDGKPIRLDLLTGGVASETGQLLLQCWSDPKNKKPGKEFDWKLKISIPSGGILQTDEEFPFSAPEVKYETEHEIKMTSTKEEGWLNMVERSFVYRLSDGRYGRLKISFISYNGVLRFESYLNPSGSRNLEYDEKVQPKPTHFE